MSFFRLFIPVSLIILNLKAIKAYQPIQQLGYQHIHGTYDNKRKTTIPEFNTGKNDKLSRSSDNSNILAEIFIPSTKISGNINFVAGSVINGSKGEAIHSTFEYKLKIVSSLTGRDLLITNVEAGNARDSSLGLDLQSSKGDQLHITNLYYTFPLNEELKVSLGPKMYGYVGLAGTSTAYNERIAILDGSNYSTSAGNGAGMAISYLNNNGFNSTIKLSASDSSNSSKGMFRNQSSDSIIYQIGYGKESYGSTLTYNKTDTFKAYALAIYINPENLPSISASIESKDSNYEKDVINWLLAIGLKNELSSFGAGIGTYNTNENLAYESWYSVNLTDSTSIIPIMFLKKEGNVTEKKDELGIAVNLKLKF